MTLKEKIQDVEVEKGMSDRLESIADEFAIDFAEWINLNAYKFPTKTTTKELLEIYKKGL